MIDDQTLKRYYTSFMENMRLAEPMVWVSIQQQTITKPDFILAMGKGH